MQLRAQWEYLRVPGEPDLDQLGREGWELVALRGSEWLFKRPEPDPSERFALQQRAAALADIPGHQGHCGGRRLLNPAVAALIRQVNHTQLLLIADRGFPVPPLPIVVDLSLVADVPTVPQVLDAVLPDLPADRIILAEEHRTTAPAQAEEHGRLAVALEFVPHVQFKRLARHAVGCIRTGDATPYANLLVVGG